MAELDDNKPATEDSDSSGSAANDSCDCNEILTTMKQLEDHLHVIWTIQRQFKT